MYSYGKYAKAAIRDKVVIGENSQVALFMLLFTAFTVTELPKSWRLALRKAIPLYTVSNAILVIWTAIFGVKFGNSGGYQGFLDYSGMNAVLMASCAGFFTFVKQDRTCVKAAKLTGFALLITALILSRSAIGWGVLAVALFFSTWSIWVVHLSVIGGIFAVGAKMFDSSMRFPAYKLFMGELFRAKAWIWGTGLGTFKLFSPTIQAQHHFMETPTGNWIFVWMHSDILQSWFEGGVFTFLLLLIVLTIAGINLLKRGDWEILSLFCGLVAGALLDYPARYFPTALLSMFALVEGLRTQSLPKNEK